MGRDCRPHANLQTVKQVAGPWWGSFILYLEAGDSMLSGSTCPGVGCSASTIAKRVEHNFEIFCSLTAVSKLKQVGLAFQVKLSSLKASVLCSDLVITHALEWPSLTVQWLPVSSDPYVCHAHSSFIELCTCLLPGWLLLCTRQLVSSVSLQLAFSGC